MKPNNLKIWQNLFCLSLLLCVGVSILLAQKDASMLLQEGLYEEDIRGDLQRAIAIYERVIAEFPRSREEAATAQLHIGLCCEKLGLQKAMQAYQKVIDDYPDQLSLVALAKLKLDKLKEPEIHPLVRRYFERMPPDVMTDISHDGQFVAYTDWSNGNVMIRNRESGQATKLTDIDWTKTHEFASHPVWSRDGKYIAYSQFKKLNFIELRVVSVNDAKTRFIYSAPDMSISPQDWDPNGKRILCEVFDFTTTPAAHRLELIAMDGDIQPLADLSTYSRGMKFSPDGAYIAFDLLKGKYRHVFLYDLKNRRVAQISSGRATRVGFDSPAWSADGKLLLYRNRQRGRYDLWATPIENGQASGSSFIVDSDIVSSLLRIKGIDESDINQPDAGNVAQVYTASQDSGDFDEDFFAATLGKAWSVYQWKKPNVYGAKSFGRYSLTDHPGWLRYYVDPMTVPGRSSNYLPGFDEWWYWYYPSLEIRRLLHGDRWTLETRMTFSMVYGANSRNLRLIIYFAPQKELQAALTIAQDKTHNGGRLVVVLNDGEKHIARNDSCLSPGDRPGVANMTYRFLITRLDSLITVEMSEDDDDYRPVLRGVLPPRLRQPLQQLALTGGSWFVPAGSYAEWDYFRFRRVK